MTKESFTRPYNKNKIGYKRRGLSLFSHDGGDSGEIDLGSIREYNFLNNTNYSEMSFNKPTKHWNDFHEVSNHLEPIADSIGRSHFISFDEGGFFPPHRDLGKTYRLISFFDCSPLSLYFILDNKKIAFTPGYFYFANTRKSHSLFSFQKNSIILVLNIEISQKTTNFVLSNLLES